MQFAQIIGHQDLKSRLIATARENRVAHAQLFCGPEGIGKLQLAIAYAQYLNCEHPTPTDSCGHCPSCMQFQKLQHPDLHFAFPTIKTKNSNPTCDEYMGAFRQMIIERGYFGEDDWYAETWGENKQAQIYANESSEILRKLSLKSFEGGYKTMIIWLPEKMNETCANKILKILEEPPTQTLFILVSNQPDRLLSTILSRTQITHIKGLSEGEITAALMRRFDDIERSDANHAARLSHGSYLHAVKLIEQSGNSTVYFTQFTQLMRYAWLVRHKKDYTALQAMRAWSNELADKSVGRERQKQFLQYAQRMVRENFIRNLGQPELNYMTDAEESFSKNFAPYINETNVEGMMNELAKAERYIDQNVNPKMVFFNLAMQTIMLIR